MNLRWLSFALLALSLAFAGQAQASTVLWDFSIGPTGDLGTDTYASLGYVMTLTGHSSGSASDHLWRFSSGNDKGLGVKGGATHEIDRTTDRIRIDLGSLVSQLTNWKIKFSSIDHEGNNYLDKWGLDTGDNSDGSGATTLLSNQTTPSMTNLTGIHQYLFAHADRGDVLLWQIQAETVDADPNRAAVPEPGTLSLLALGGGALGFLRRRGNASQTTL